MLYFFFTSTFWLFSLFFPLYSSTAGHFYLRSHLTNIKSCFLAVLSLLQTETVSEFLCLVTLVFVIQHLGHISHLNRFDIPSSQVRYLSHHLALLPGMIDAGSQKPPSCLVCPWVFPAWSRHAAYLFFCFSLFPQFHQFEIQVSHKISRTEKIDTHCRQCRAANRLPSCFWKIRCSRHVVPGNRSRLFSQHSTCFVKLSLNSEGISSMNSKLIKLHFCVDLCQTFPSLLRCNKSTVPSPFLSPRLTSDISKASFCVPNLLFFGFSFRHRAAHAMAGSGAGQLPTIFPLPRKPNRAELSLPFSQAWH